MNSFERFSELASTAGADGAIVPVWRDCVLDGDTPVSAFARLRAGQARDQFSFLLESAPAGGETWSRYTFMGSGADSAWRLRDGVVEDWTPAHGWHGTRRPADPLVDLTQRLARFNPVDVPELGPFWCGAVGYFGYDVARCIENLPAPPPRALDVPDALFLFPHAVVILDSLRAQARVVVPVEVPSPLDAAALRRLYESADEAAHAVIRRLRSPAVLPPLELTAETNVPECSSSYSRPDFVRDVERIREYIHAGDCFQVLLARRLSLRHDFPADLLYRALRAINPSPYMFHLDMQGIELVGSSPELLVRVAEGRVTVRPIAGTRRRGRTAAEDQAMEVELASDEKERAEHLMLVDLGRNDVGRLAAYGSVRVTDLMRVERYSHVLHLVSQVEGDLPDGASALDALAATFPAGTMTGAPKIRAMQIIDELEPERRGPYAGAIGYITAGGGRREGGEAQSGRAARMDLAITIRTCVMAHGTASVHAGAGIVADSVPELEWLETENKARALLVAIAHARNAARNAESAGRPL